MSSDDTCKQHTNKQTSICNKNSPTVVHEYDSSQQFQHKKQEYEMSSSLSIKLPSVQEFNIGVEENDEPTTPTSSDQRIPVPITCPPAPRKPGSVPMRNKRKTSSIRRISVDLMVKINAMFVPPAAVFIPDILAGDLGAGDSRKKVKKAHVTIGSST